MVIPVLDELLEMTYECPTGFEDGEVVASATEAGLPEKPGLVNSLSAVGEQRVACFPDVSLFPFSVEGEIDLRWVVQVFPWVRGGLE